LVGCCGLAYVTGPGTGSGEALHLACPKAHNLTNQVAYSLLLKAGCAIYEYFRSSLRTSTTYAFICTVFLWTFTYLALCIVTETDVYVTNLIPSKLLILLVSISVG
jgi:hypothetical protein